MEGRSRFHANMFNLAIVDDVYDESSIHREKRAKELMPARSIRDAMEIMGDTYVVKLIIFIFIIIIIIILLLLLLSTSYLPM